MAMIVTIATAGLCGLLYFVLSLRVVLVRQSAKVSIGDGGNDLLLSRIRAHANFAEYVPICLILMLAIEASWEVSPPALWIAGLALVAVRISHALGMARAAPNAFRIAGAAGTWLVMIALSLWAIATAFTY